MKIVLVIHHTLTRNAGAAGVILSLASEYRNLGHDVAVVSHDDIKMPKQVRKVLFPLFCSWMLWTRHRGADVVDASAGTAWIYFRSNRRNGRSLYVAHSHGLSHVVHDVLMESVKAGRSKISWKYPLFNGSFALYEDAETFRAADLSLFLNSFDMHYAIDRLRVSTDKVQTVPNGLGDLFLQSAASIPLNLRTRRDRIVQVGSYLPRKGVQTTLEAMRIVMQARPDAQMTYLGTQVSYDKIVNAYPEQMRQNVNVIPSFQNSALPGLLAGHDILVMPSQSEGFGLAALEAMACGVVPIVTNIPGPTEFITHRSNGLIVPANDPPALAEAVIELIKNGDLFERLRQRARTTAFDLTWTTIAAARIRLYETHLRRLRSSEPNTK